MKLAAFKITLFFALLVSVACLSAQEQSANKSKVESIFAIVKYFTWANEAAIDTFVIAVLDNKPELESDMKKYLQTQILIHKKPAKVVRFASIDEIGKCNSLFASKESGYDIDKILKIITGKKVLLITENYEFHKSMINYIYVNNVRRYEINQPKIQEEGFTVNELFAAGSVKSQADWEKLYKQTDIELQKEKEIVEAQQKVIENQKKEIAEQEQKLATQRKEIEEQQKHIDDQKKELEELFKRVKINQALLNAKLAELTVKQKELDEQKAQMVKQHKILEGQKAEIVEQESKIAEQKKVLNEQLEKIHLQQFILYMFFALALVLAGLGFFIYRAYKIKKQSNKMLTEKNNEIMQQNEEIRQQKEEIEAQRDEIERQRDEIEGQRNVAYEQRDEIIHQKKEITDSIHYARRIQQAVLPSPKFLSHLIKENYFILNKPRDIVSGDYYWLAEKDKKVIIAAADCTGHGVPGAFMSIIGFELLRKITDDQGIENADQILDELNKGIAITFGKDNSNIRLKDGMDLALCVIDKEKKELEFAGAFRPMYFIRDNKIEEIRGDRFSVGLLAESEGIEITKTTIKLEKNDVFYLFSDGYADQFGGPEGKKFKYRRFRHLLLTIHKLPMDQQKIILEKSFDEWIGNFEQVDDILIVGLRPGLG